MRPWMPSQITSHEDNSRCPYPSLSFRRKRKLFSATLSPQSPEADENGGKIVAQDTPEKIAYPKTSRTAPFLKIALDQ